MPADRFPDLTGAGILVVEDEYYLAMELKEAIERAGGTVLGPCPDAAAAHAAMEGQSPACAVLDINLGEGPSFALAETLAGRGVPFLFLTGYDSASIPPALAGVERIEKPADIGRVVATVGRLAGS